MSLQATSAMRKAPSLATLSMLESALSSLRISHRINPSIRTTAVRYASHQAQGRANGPKDGAGKRLGAKKTSGAYVVPGNILFKQRGTLWHPGDNCFMGRDHTIHAGAPGYVRYYRDPAKHPKRRYIGIVFSPEQNLPQPPNSVRRRKLGMLAYQMPEAGSTSKPELGTPAAINVEVGATSKVATLGKGYQFRRANWEIAETALNSKAAKSVVPFKPGDRWAAWRKRAARVAKNREKRAIGRVSKAGKKKK